MPKRPRVVADAGPLMALAKLNVLPLLKRLYGRVLVSQTVYDEEAGRAAARAQGVRVKGTLGVLVEAFQKGIVDFEELELLFSQIEQRDDIWISADLCRRVLAGIRKEHRGRQGEKKPQGRRA